MAARVQGSGRPLSAGSQSELDDGQAEVELQKLQRQFRAMESERKAYAEESKVQLGKQRLTIEKLRRECQGLQDELRVLDHRTDQSKTAEEQRARADALMAQITLYQKNIKSAASELASADADLATLIKQNTAAAGAIAAAAASPNALAGTPQAIDKHMRTLENRLDKALIRFNKSINNNRQLRTQVDMLRRERAVFDTVYRKFEKELADHKKQMAEIVEFSNAAYEARDEAQSKMQSVKERAEKEAQSHLAEMKELDRILEQDRRLKEFMNVKTGDRDVVDLSVHKRTKRAQNAAGGAIKGSMDGLTDSLDQYDIFLAQLLAVTETDDIHAVVKKFSHVEDQNFSLFNYVNEVNADIEKTQEEVAQLERSIQDIKQQSEQTNANRQQKLRQLEEQLAATDAQADQCDTRRATITELLDSFKRQVIPLHQQLLPKAPLPTTSLFADASSSSAAAASSAEASASATSNADLIAILSSIEQETSDLLIRNLSQALPKSILRPAAGTKNDDLQDGLDKAEEDKQRQLNAGSLLGQGPAPPVRLNVVIPNTGDDLDDDGLSDDDDRVLTREELVQRTLRGISKREKSGQPAQKGKTSRRRSPTRSTANNI